MQNWISDITSCGSRSDWVHELDRLLPPTGNFDFELQGIVDSIRNGIPLTLTQGIQLWNYPDLSMIAYLANTCKQARFGSHIFFNSNLHVNTTNICTLACKFCAFRRGRRASDAYALSVEEYIQRIEPFANYIDEVHSVGGLHPDWDVTHYETLFSATKQRFPEIHIKSLSAVEVKNLADISQISVHELLTRLRTAGLDSLPGGGAEILDDDVRNVICYGKETSEEYIEIHRTAHSIGMPTNCTMLFSTIETIEQRVAHLIKLRELQTEYSGFQCFVPYPYLPDNSRLPEAQLASANEILRTISISRLMLHNIPHIKAYRMNIGDRISEMAMHHGADDVDGTVGHEEIMHEAGSQTNLDYTKDEMAKFIQDSRGIPVLRNSIYTQFRIIDDDDDKHKAAVRLPIAGGVR
ncbi:MAG: aminofutalosine synthase MqnE [Euryarchaeota archaeon]|nr:aminofutalosine synthase MqnE [Euryarchaeota archaeon]